MPMKPDPELSEELSEGAQELDDVARQRISDLTDLKVQRKKKWSLNDRTQRAFSDVSRRLRLDLSENLDIPRKFFIMFILFVTLIIMLILFLAALGVAGRNDGTTTSPARTGATVAVQGTPSSDSDSDVGGDTPPTDDEDDVAYLPIGVHVDVGAEDTAVSDQYVSSYFQLWPAPEAEGDLPPLATPKLSGGTFEIAFDFEAMTVSGSFDLAYERGDVVELLCKGSPEAFSGTARGTFKDLPIRKAETSETPPSDWGLPAEDWWPMEADGWYVGGSFPVELAMSGVVVMSCASLDGGTIYNETPFDETATIMSWMKMTVDVHRDQGADHKTVAFVELYTTTNEAFTVKPYWDHSFAWSEVFERPIPDPLG